LLDRWAIAGQNSGYSIDGLIDNALAGRPLQVELHRTCTLGHVTTLFVPLLRPILREALVAQAEAAYDNSPAGLPADAREREFARLDEQLLALERAEEQALQVAEANGLAIDRREDADPRVVLGSPNDRAAFLVLNPFCSRRRRDPDLRRDRRRGRHLGKSVRRRPEEARQREAADDPHQ
jgi:hypothetical protein